MQSLVCAVGDLVEDVVVRLAAPPVPGADTVAIIERHRGGSAANTAAAVARRGGPARFVGQVGADATGDRLLDELRALGVECLGPRGGTTGTVVSIVNVMGERTMYSDRGASAALAAYDERWLRGVALVHVPYYALAGASSSAVHRVVTDAGDRDIRVSLDPSSTTFDTTSFTALVREARPAIVFCNDDEALALGVDGDGLEGADLVVVKRGSRPTRLCGAVRATVPVPPVDAVIDTTGAGDAFAGGFLHAFVNGANPLDATHAAHDAAASVVRGPGADAFVPVSQCGP